MALKSTVFKFSLNLADLDRQLYDDFSLTLARHPSETDQRLMLRVLAFALNAGPGLEFGRGISTEDEPDLWRKNLAGDIELWIELGTPDPERLRKACRRSDTVYLYCYGDRATPVWWEKHASALRRFENLEIWQIPDQDSSQLADMASPGAALHCTVSDADILVISGQLQATIKPTLLYSASNG